MCNITQVGDDDIATITLDINEVEAALGTVFVAEGSTGHVIVTELADFPTTGDTTYNLDSISTDVVSTDPILTVVTTPGVAPLYDQVFTLDLDETLLAQLVMDTLDQTGLPGTIGLQAGSGIVLNYDAANYNMLISSNFTDPVKWLSLIDDFGAFLDPSSPASTLAFLGDGGLVSGGFDGISATLNANPAAAELQLINTDPGSGQLIFGTVAVLGEADILALTNTDTLTFVAGANIGLTTDALAQSLTIVNEIDHVYSDVIADNLLSLQAGSTTSTLEIVGGLGITTFGTAGPTNSISIENDANVYATIDGDAGAPTTATNLADTLSIVGGTGCSTTISPDTVTVENTGVTSLAAVAGEGISVSGPTGAVTVANTGAQFVTADVTIAGGVVTSPAAGAVDVTAQGISSTYMSVQLVSFPGNVLIPLTATNLIVDQMGAGAGTFRIANGTLLNGDYVLMITGQF